MATGEHFQIFASGESNKGPKRDHNEDAFFLDSNSKTYMVCDGVGGSYGGEVASRLACQYFEDYINSHQIEDKSSFAVKDFLRTGLLLASKKVYLKSLETPNLKGMGTTASVVKISDDQAYCAFVGDSRIYLCRQGFLYQISKDHNVFIEQKDSDLNKKQETMPLSSGILSRYIGHKIKERVDTTEFKIEKDDIILICSDGLYNYVEIEKIRQILFETKDKGSRFLVQQAIHDLSQDNITALTVHIS